MLPFTDVLIILIAHTFADFWVQTDNQAINKSSSNAALLVHVTTYTNILIVCFVVLTWNPVAAVLLASVNGLMHLATDYVTSRVGKYYYAKEMRRRFFQVLGVDQFIHIAGLLFTYNFYLSMGTINL